MDFIERWFGISPDGGDGTLELLYVAVGVLIAAVVVARIMSRLRYRRSGQRGR
jgi:cytochrome b561